MNLSRIFIERPVMTALVTFAILLFGVVAYRGLPVAALPSVDYPTIVVSAGLPGASPETMASSVATPLEREFSTIAGISSMSSTNSQGGTQITVQFTLDRNIDAAAQDIQAAISKAGGNLPVGRLYGEKQAFTIQSSGQLSNAAAYRPLIVSYRNGLPVRLDQLGNVIDSVENNKVAAWFNGTRGVILAVQRQPGTNTVGVVDNIKELLPTLRAEIP